jgi:biotin operon repressor
MVIKEAIEIFREDTSIETFKKEIELLKSAGYKISKENNDYVFFSQSTTVVDSDLLINKKCK